MSCEKKLYYCIQGQGHSEGSKCQCPDYIFLNCQNCYKTLYCDASSWARMLCKKIAYFKAKVTAMTHMIKVWQFLQSVLNCWSFHYQTLFEGTLLYARVSYEEIGLLCSRSRSQQNFKMSVNVCPDDIFWIAKPFITKLVMMMHHHEP